MPKNKIDFNYQLPTTMEISEMFDMVPKMEHYKVYDKVVAAGVKPIVQRARALCQNEANSQKTGSKKKWSRKMFIDGGTSKGKRKGTPRSLGEKPLWKTIKYVIRKYEKVGVGVVGPEWPEGNKVFFNVSQKGRRQVLWGKRTGRVVAAIRNFIVQAFDETRHQQLQAIKIQLKKSIDELMRGK